MNTERQKVSVCYRYGLYSSQEYDHGGKELLDHVAMLWTYGTSIHSVTPDIISAIRKETGNGLFSRTRITGPERIERGQYRFRAYRTSGISGKKKPVGVYIVLESAVE